MELWEAVQEERKKHPEVQVLVAALNEYEWDQQITVRRDCQVTYEPFLYWEDNEFFDDYDDCVVTLMDRLGISEEEAEKHIEEHGYEEAIVIYAY